MAEQQYLAAPKAPPALNIPHSSNTVKVRIIDPGVRLKATQMSKMMSPSIKGHDFFTCPSYSFLIENHSDHKSRKILFDLSLRTDWRDLAPVVVQSIDKGGFEIGIVRNVSEILEHSGVELNEIEAVIWRLVVLASQTRDVKFAANISHWHWDHIGDPSTFPSTTDLVVGPGFKENMLPGWPQNMDAPIKESDYSGRRLQQVDFAVHGQEFKIGRFDAFDYFGDGSFYLLDAPGHAIGHLCALARTTFSPASFMFLGADCCHYSGEFRPTPYLPLPKSITPNPIHTCGGGGQKRCTSSCPGSLFLDIHPKKSATEPFYTLPTDAVQNGVVLNWDHAVVSMENMAEFDAADDVFVILAHDEDLLDVVDFFPKEANNWMEKGWAEETKWAFLKDFRGSVEAEKLSCCT